MKIETNRDKAALAEARDAGVLAWFIKAKTKREVAALFELLDKYEIPRQDRDAFFYLALALARHHIKNFPYQRARGRPRNKLVKLADLLYLGAKRPKKKGGRPHFWTPERYEAILDVRRIGEEQLRKDGKARITDRAALEAGIKQMERQEVDSQLTSRDISVTAADWAKRLPDARKSIRKSPK